MKMRVVNVTKTCNDIRLLFTLDYGLPAKNVQITDAKPASKTVPTKTEQQLWAADLAEHGFRSVGRLLAAGHAFTFLDNTPKRQCLKDFQKLLGHYFDMSTFPVKGGRQVIAGEDTLHGSCNVTGHCTTRHKLCTSASCLASITLN